MTITDTTTTEQRRYTANWIGDHLLTIAAGQYLIALRRYNDEGPDAKYGVHTVAPRITTFGPPFTLRTEGLMPDYMYQQLRFVLACLGRQAEDVDEMPDELRAYIKAQVIPLEWKSSWDTDEDLRKCLVVYRNPLFDQGTWDSALEIR